MKHFVVTMLSLILFITLDTSQNNVTAGLASSPLGGLTVNETDQAVELFLEFLYFGFTAEEAFQLMDMVLAEK